MTDQQKTYSCISNRWINSIFRNYGVLKQRIFREIIEQLQPAIKSNFQGKTILFKPGLELCLDLDMSRIMRYNNYYQVKKALKEMCTDLVDIYNDSSYKSFTKESFRPAPLLQSWEPNKGRMVKVVIKKNIAELLMNLDKKNVSIPIHFTLFKPLKNIEMSCKYTYPLHMLMSTYAGKAGFTMTLEELRTRIQVEEKYKGFDNFNKKILKHVQAELKIFGQYCFNYTTIKTGKTVKKLIFKVWANTTKLDENHIWLKIQKALQEDLPHFLKFSADEREHFNYLLTGKYNLQEVYDKLHYIHKAIEKKYNTPNRIPNVWAYTWKAMHNDFPPPG